MTSFQKGSSLYQACARSAKMISLALLISIDLKAPVTIDVEQFFKTQNRIAEQWGECFALLQEKEKQFISPFGDGYWKEFVKCWDKSTMDRDWEKLEKFVAEVKLELKEKRK